MTTKTKLATRPPLAKPSKTPPRRGYAKRAAQEDAILAAAEEIFAQHGYKGTSLEDIAERAGISKQNMLYYFPSKLELYRRLLNEILDGWLGSLELFSREHANPAEAVRAYVREKLVFSRTRPNASRIYAMEIIAGAPHFAKEIKKRVVPQTRAAAVAFDELWAGKRSRDFEPTHVIFLIWATTQTYADFSRQMELVLGRSLTLSDFAAAEEMIVTMVLRTVGLETRSSGEAC